MGRRLFSCLGKVSSSSRVQGKNNGTVVDSSAATCPDGPVLVELFSSQGCATSSEAELLLSRLVRGDYQLDAPVLVLSYHVDNMGGKDPYASSKWTVRQKAYVQALKIDDMFIPRVVVQGRAHCPANEEDALLSTIASAPRFPAPKFKCYGNNVDNVMVALYESGLVNECLNGENKGKTLYNDFVVRKLEKLHTMEDISAMKTLSVTVRFTLWDGFNSNKCSIVVFVQNISQQIFGSQNFQLPDDL
ncbi:hypothetical protein E1A91_D08G029200v1 [Gossypium mustelinum]|uniref:Uncharacterized protein n=1 Tax=Gossypium mustelinum TaxID=34275 RepID=A0A5D2TTB2_GOSMU|nr:hypothetical protein E1A91_D08G029200v1 [Gossypium mustelinum]